MDGNSETNEKLKLKLLMSIHKYHQLGLQPFKCFSIADPVEELIMEMRRLETTHKELLYLNTIGEFTDLIVITNDIVKTKIGVDILGSLDRELKEFTVRKDINQ